MTDPKPSRIIVAKTAPLSVANAPTALDKLAHDALAAIPPDSIVCGMVVAIACAVGDDLASNVLLHFSTHERISHLQVLENVEQAVHDRLAYERDTPTMPPPRRT
jgi:hypothetical protein